MADIHITFDDGGLVRRLNGAGDVLAAELTTAVRVASFRGEGRSKAIVRDKDRIDLGQLINSIATDPIVRIGRMVRGGWGASAAHAEVHEKGRGAGKKMPPSGVMLPWMARHGIPEEAEFVVRRAIGRRGIPGIWFMRDSLEQVRPIFRRECEIAVARAIRRLGGGR